jgi:hypothetical protein
LKKERGYIMSIKLKYYLVAYIFGYIISLLYSGIPTLNYLIPIKTVAVIFAFGFGNAVYYKLEEKVGLFKLILINTKYGVISMIILILSTFIKEELALAYNLDISFITAPF